MKALVIDGSRRAKSNTAPIVDFLQRELTDLAVDAETWRVPAWTEPTTYLDDLLDALRACDAVVLVAPLYLDQVPAVLQRALEDLYARREELAGSAPTLYGIAHSGFPEPEQRQAELRTMELFAGAMGWPWMGGAGFGGTSPIDGRALEAAGMFGRRLRQGLPLVAADVAAGRRVSERTARRCARSPFPLPRRLIIAAMNSRTRKIHGTEALQARPYEESEA